jgi:long-chain acyl-CoA synthetase
VVVVVAREFSVPIEVEIAASANTVETVLARAKRSPDEIMFRRKDGGESNWRDVTAAEFCREMTALADALAAAGIEAGERVALMSRTRYEWTLIDYACWAAGAVTVPIYETCSG